MEQEEDIQSLLAEAPSFLPALTLALAESHAAAQGPAAAPLPQLPLGAHDADLSCPPWGPPQALGANGPRLALNKRQRPVRVST